MTSHCRQGHDLARLLPDDLLADVLRRLEPRWLATSRCVCKAWHAVVDTHHLLRADLLPRSLDGIIINFRDQVFSEFFSRPSRATAPSISGKFEHLITTDAWFEASDHCNGLLLLEDVEDDGYVANPATGWAQHYPPCPSPCAATEGDYYSNYLVFDPTISTHYQVFSVPCLSQEKMKPEALEKSEWPPSRFVMRVFSSVSQRWEERSFSREGKPAGSTAGFRSDWDKRPAAYWRGSLYVHGETDFVMRISPSKGEFRVIEPPIGVRQEMCPILCLGKSEKGVYFASLNDWRLRVWILDESYGHIKWVLKHNNNLGPMLGCPAGHQHVRGPWILQDINYCSGVHGDDPAKWRSAPLDEKFEWNSDNDDAQVPIKAGPLGFINILGFHPYKEIIFFGQSMQTGLAYYLNSSRIKVLGNLYPTGYGGFVGSSYTREIILSFPYTPCLIEMCLTDM